MQNINDKYILKAKNSQTIWEVALQEYGSVEGVRYLVQDNPELYGVFVFMPLIYLDGVVVRFGEVINPVVKKYFDNHYPPGNSNKLLNIGGLPKNKFNYTFE